jgi:hypothetical protein
VVTALNRYISKYSIGSGRTDGADGCCNIRGLIEMSVAALGRDELAPRTRNVCHALPACAADVLAGDVRLCGGSLVTSDRLPRACRAYSRPREKGPCPAPLRQV